MNGSCEVTTALSITSVSGPIVPSAATTKADGSTNDAAAWDASEKSAIEYGLNPEIRPADPSRPITTVPAAGGELGTETGPVGAIGAGRPGGVQPASTRTPTRTAMVRPGRNPGSVDRAARTAPTLRI